MIAEALTAAASIFGGLFGKKKKQETTTRVDYGRMVADATAAGFNPLTAIRNGGSAGFTTTTSPTISNTPEILSNLGGVLGQALGDKLDPINAKKREIDTLLVDRQLRQLKEGPRVAGSFQVPRTYTGTKVSQQLVPRLGASSSNKTASVPATLKAVTPNYQTEDAKRVKYGDDTGWQANPFMPSADTIEQDFGDVAGSIYGIPKVLGDLGWNGYRLAKRGYADYKKHGPGFQKRQSASAGGAKMGASYRKPYTPSGGGGGGW